MALKMKPQNLFIISIICALFISCKEKNATNKNYCLNSQEKAIELAEKEWLSTYGNSIYSKKPFKAKLINDSIWVVTGSLPYSENGGVPTAEINAKNCKFILVSHGK